MIVLLLGAGFSAPLGVPTMRQLHDAFVDLASQRYPQLDATLADVREKAGAEADVEALLRELGRAADAADAIPPDMRTNEITGLSSDARSLRSHLLAYIVERCEGFDREKTTALVGPFVQALADRGATVMTTNYDRVIEYACDRQGIEAADGFTRQRGLNVSPWTADLRGPLALVKLHGSVTWYRQKGGSMVRLDRGYPLPDFDFALARDGQVLEPLLVAPSLEKQVLDEPYTHLAGVLQQVLERSKLLVIVGSSLRDSHINGRIRFRGPDLPVLIVGRHPDLAADRLAHPTTATLQVEIGTFLREGLGPLLELIDSMSATSSGESLGVDRIREWAAAQSALLARWDGLDEGQRSSLLTFDGGTPLARIGAIRALHGVSHPTVISALRRQLDHDDPEVCSAAAGALGIARAADAVDDLARLARENPGHVVRLEASLALRRIDTELARSALAGLGAALENPLLRAN